MLGVLVWLKEKADFLVRKTTSSNVNGPNQSSWIRWVKYPSLYGDSGDSEVFPKPQTAGWGWSRVGWDFKGWCGLPGRPVPRMGPPADSVNRWFISG